MQQNEGGFFLWLQKMQILNINMNFTFVVWLLIKTQFVARWPDGVLLKLSHENFVAL